MKYAHYNNVTKKILGWYSLDVHEIIPEPNIEVSEDTWQDALDNGYNCIDEATKTLKFKDFRTQEEIIEDHNTNILQQLEEIDKKSIRPLRDGDTVRVQALEDEAIALRSQLM